MRQRVGGSTNTTRNTRKEGKRNSGIFKSICTSVGGDAQDKAGETERGKKFVGRANKRAQGQVGTGKERDEGGWGKRWKCMWVRESTSLLAASACNLWVGGEYYTELAEGGGGEEKKPERCLGINKIDCVKKRG